MYMKLTIPSWTVSLFSQVILTKYLMWTSLSVYGLTPIVHQPTRGANVLDRIYVSEPCYSSVRVVTSIVRSDHKAVVTYTDKNKCAQTKKTSIEMVYRTKTPEQHALFLQAVADINFEFIETADDVQIQFDIFYDACLLLLDNFYPLCTIKVTNRDPTYITPDIKRLLRRKNRLMRRGRLKEASALAQRIGKAVTRVTKSQLSNLGNTRTHQEMR